MHPSSRPCLLAALIASAISCGCATRQVCVKPIGDPSLTPSEAASSDGASGSVVSWGGQVIATRGLNAGTELEITGYPLDDCGRPLAQGQPLGRFLVRHRGYLEPLDYRAGRQVTVTGRIIDVADGRIGDADRRFPILDESAIRLWPERKTPDEVSVRPSRPWISIGIGGGSGHVGGGIGIGF
ncbi:Slp family lipoprotein [uncultured Thiocystis sp.]|jgi:outer membrane lipoprotein|uniref:Slp family lipoprotein n=1 Tax=uncultured Thiocystis sp. TaxID=1202134 RepID=UPI0025DDB36B|nr:Slp family lipoprotein [uncultured Thiocystis sp.]